MTWKQLIQYLVSHNICSCSGVMLSNGINPVYDPKICYFYAQIFPQQQVSDLRSLWIIPPIYIMSISGGNCSISLLLSSCKLYSLHIKSLVLSIYIYIKKATLILEPSKSIKLLLIIIDCVIDHRSQCITANNTFFLAYVVNPSC